jgi:hypothetical protein
VCVLEWKFSSVQIELQRLHIIYLFSNLKHNSRDLNVFFQILYTFVRSNAVLWVHTESYWQPHQWFFILPEMVKQMFTPSGKTLKMHNLIFWCAYNLFKSWIMSLGVGMTVSPADFYQNVAKLYNYIKHWYWLKISSLDVNIMYVNVIDGRGRAKKVVATWCQNRWIYTLCIYVLLVI